MSTETNVVVESVGPAKKRLKISIPAAVVDRKIAEALAAVRADAQLPGFRRGAAPPALIEKRFGEAILQDARQQLLSEAYQKALEEHKINPVGEPEVDEASRLAEFRRGAAINLTLDVEIVPEFAIPALESLGVKKPVTEIAEKYVGEEIRRLGYRFGVPARIDGPFEHLDRMLGKATVRVKGSKTDPFFETEQALVVVPDAEDEGKGQLLGLLIEDLGPKLKGKKVGDTATFTTTGPEAHEREELRGAEITITFTPTQAERIAPAEPEKIAEMLGLGNIENLRQQVKLGLEGRRDQEQRAAMREQAAEWLVDQVDFPLPEKMSGAQVARNIEMARLQMLSQGANDDEIERRLAEIRGASELETRRRLKLFFVLARLAQEFGVGVTEGELNAAIVQMARSREMRPDAVRAELEKNGRLNEMALAIREAKTLDRVLEKAKVEEIAAEEWNKHVADRQKQLQQQARAGAKKPAKGAAKE